jgi:5-methylcytosine-specific restriction enzyme subunit McrC
MVMNAVTSPKQLELTEYIQRHLAPEAIPVDVGRALWQAYDQQGGKLRVEFPTPRTGNRWCLQALGWVGHIQLPRGYQLTITPKIHLANIFHMWQYAYQLHSFRLLEGVFGVQSLRGFYELLAQTLARRILNRIHKGLHHTYIPRSGQLPYVRGRFNLSKHWRTPTQFTLDCHYHEFTADIPDNQILLFTLGQVARSQLCRQEVQYQVRRAYLALNGLVTHRGFQPSDCLDRTYTRLNQDYQPLHALCRFLMEHSGPLQQSGASPMLPFLVDMARLYELFVAEWLKAHIPPSFRLVSQERVDIDQAGVYHFNIDLVLYHQARNSPMAVLDTKYRTPDKAASHEIAQVVAYAQARRSPRAILIYPTPLPTPLDARVGRHVHVRSLVFPLEGDLEEAGQQFLSDLFADEMP